MTAETKEISAIAPSVVKDFVAQAHGNLDRVKDLLAEYPTLVNACHDWGGGDWETGLGAAAHMGRRDIAQVLLASGARMDIFAAAMLGHLTIVKAMLDEYPAKLHDLGPHGIPLEAHARAGGEQARDVVEYLHSSHSV